MDGGGRPREGQLPEKKRWRFEPAGETFISNDRTDMTPSFERAASQRSFLDSSPDDDKTPARPEIAQFLVAERERRADFARDITKFLSDLPESLSIPALYELVKLPKEEVRRYEDMYRFLDGNLKEILERHVPSLHLPSFDRLMEDAHHGGTLVRSMRESFRQEAAYLLGQRLFFEVMNHLSLFAAFAANIENARHIQEHGVGDR